jgi:hypothetical protein
LKRIRTGYRWQDRSVVRMSWLWFSCLALLALLPQSNLAEAHLWKSRPFRANDTDHSGGDHICDLRRDSNADGKPDRLGDYVTVPGTVTVEPSTFETGGWIFWVHQGDCGILVYGEPECLSLGDSVVVAGWVRTSNGGYFFPETGLASLGDISLENTGVWRRGTGTYPEPLNVRASQFAASPAAWAGNIVALDGPVKLTRAVPRGPDMLAWAACGGDTMPIYVDYDTGCSVACGRCYRLTGVVARMMGPPGSPPSGLWCLVPRDAGDIREAPCSTVLKPARWGHLKSMYSEVRRH